MCWKNTKDRWGIISQSFHWIIALLIIGLAIVGDWMSDLPPDETKWFIYGWHKQLGALLLSLAVLRILWRMMNVTPVLPNFMPDWQKLVSKLNVFILYIIMFGFPITGLTMSLLGGHDVSLFGFYTLKAFPKTPELEGIAKTAWEVHGMLLWALIGFGSLHILAAVYHHFILKDNVLKRMLPMSFSKS
ncbi:Cytochrome b561 [Candidatus Bealeia paramacronuclearis]|uniref:Cytochrome b561 n=1 Tax=Candidatus Bealeia paramacronuclearis TaxID=1921001 RepID=A0ABZ2C668_9PROT|nr:Cytochrome b561 [Candidatus Bealeia paramacronuclearis]